MSSWIPLLLLACLSESPQGDPGEGSGGTDTAGSGSGDAAPAITPVWSAEEAIDALQAALDAGLPQPSVARDTYLGLISTGQDTSCPGTMDFDGSQPLGCVSESGYLYAGISQYREEEQGWSLGGDFVIEEPDGRGFHGAGHLIVHGDEIGRMVEFTGSWSHEGGLDWLATGRSGMFMAMVGSGRFELDGGLDLGGTYLHFDEVWVEQHGQLSLSGSLGIRDEAGAWWWLELGNDGCGDLSFGERVQGTGCVALEAPLEAWMAGLGG